MREQERFAVTLSVLEASGVDCINTFSGARLRANGMGTMSMMWPILDSNKQTLDYTEQDILPAISGKAFVCACLNANDPLRDMHTVLEHLKIARKFMSAGRARKGPVVSDELLALFPELPSRFAALAGNLSGGQRQMLAFACALTVKPDLLIMDEPSAGLSPKYMTDIFDCIKKVNGTGVSVLMVEQNAIEALRISDQRFVTKNISPGNTGTPARLSTSAQNALSRAIEAARASLRA